MHVSVRTILLVLGLLILGTSACAIGQETNVPGKRSVTGTTMGPIPYKVTVAQAPDSLTEDQLQTMVQSTLDRVNGLMSTYIAESDVSRFNNSESTEFQTVDRETAEVVARAIEISKQTDGAFDITVGPAVNLWNFGPDKSDFKLPDQREIDSVMKRIGYQKLEVRVDPPALRKTAPNVKIDLSAIAKGYAVDEVAKTLEDFGLENFIVEVGGEVTTRGERPGRGKWRVGIKRPDSPPGVFDHIAVVSGMAMATSGDYRNFVQRDGKRYSHTIDPQTGRPVTHRLASACVIASDCMTADALATAVMVLGASRGKALCEEMGVDYVLAARESDLGDRFVEFQSPTFPLLDVSKPEADEASGGASIWPTFLAAAIIFGMMIVAMAVGSIFGNKPVQGSCGGLANMTNDDGETSCGICSKPVTDCIEPRSQTPA